MVHVLDQRAGLTSLGEDIWKEISSNTGRELSACRKFGTDYMIKLSGRNGLVARWSRADDMFFEEGLIKYGADPELWNKLRVLLPDKSVDMLKERYKWLWRLCDNLPPVQM